MMEMAVPPDNTAEPGRGTVPGRLDDWFARREPVIFIALLVALRLSAYSGWLVVEAEQDPAKAHPLTYARMGHEGVTRALAAAGL